MSYLRGPALVPIAVTIIVVLLIGGIAADIADPDTKAAFQEEQAEAAAYCEYVHGSDELVLVGGGILHRGGYYCSANTGSGSHPTLPHVPEWAEERALEHQRGDTIADRDAFIERVQAERAPPGRSAAALAAIAATITVLAGVIAGLSRLLNRDAGDADGAEGSDAA